MKTRVFLLRAANSLLWIGALGVVVGCAQAVTGQIDDEEEGSGGYGAGTGGAGTGGAGMGGAGTGGAGMGGSGGASCGLETCNGLDDDCDGFVDDSPMDVGGLCTTNLPGACSAGTSSCASGMLSCSPTVMPSVEACNGLDDDCDGAVDNGNPGGGGACSTGLSGACAAGTLTCSSGVLACVGNVAAVAEVCGDGVDNNCNGTVDDGCGGGACAHSPCVSGGALDPACDSCADLVCFLDPYCCSSSWDSTCVSEAVDYCVCP